MTDYALDGHAVRAHFERAADSYDSAAALQAEVARRLVERLEMVKLQPVRILDLGAGTGLAAAGLLERYSRARVIASDLALGMLRHASRRGRWRHRPFAVAADAAALPFCDGAFDLVCSSLMLQWCHPPGRVFDEVRRMLAPGGLFMFATLGPDTLRELRASWAEVDGGRHVGLFMDMHDLGDAMLRAGFLDPVVDVERITLTYNEVTGLLRDLKALGATNASAGRGKGLGGRTVLTDMCRAYETYRRDDGLLPATYEVVYGHAWVGEGRMGKPESMPEAPVSLEWLRRGRKE